ncbi:transglutaminase family protein [Methylobacterium sp. 092160098-2]|jgi:transglutaminase-like putative cysteine protease|uniref:transglutaminase-like domain-containing protein n=1 Tax=Methylobacterium TaxID=407 RepID=UPI0006AFA12C|nr:MULTISPECIES: transglutaminase family protein [unclassified Methylobacterium]KOX52323.1 transglutaminase [Streptomyces purpurogeneiscleroticus]MBP30892.1 transglutaminase family protein [Methylobacterium sp.]MDE4912515.1 transglutaminase family protein [Methylobacterium sp. 092160098-2]WFS04994.1 transglutaminase family protein [Methylobacterium sp. 391_Methyba4]
MRYILGCSLSYNILSDTTFIFNLEVAKLKSVEILTESLVLTPNLKRDLYTTPDHQNRYLAVNVPTGQFALEYNAEVDLTVHRADPATINETPIGQLPLDILPFLLPSRFVSSDRLTPFALAEFGALPKGYGRVNQICNWIHDHIAYQPGSSDGETTAHESLLKRAGVCRDFAHLGAAFCRALGIPARFVSCYAHGLVPSDFHAVFEAYLDGRWWLFDATRQADLDGLVRIGVGRDAAEIAFSTPFGNMQPVNQQVRIQRADGQGSPMPRTVDAISTEIPAPQSGAA